MQLADVALDFERFSKSIIERSSKLGIDLSSIPIDHICFRAMNSEDYVTFLEYFKSKSSVMLQRFHHERAFNIFILKTPLEIAGQNVSIIEYAQPGGSNEYTTGFQHIEIITLKSCEDFTKDENLLDRGAFGDEPYIKWSEDNMALKVTKASIIPKILSQGGTTLTSL